MDSKEQELICSQIAWVERYLYELDWLSPPTPNFSERVAKANRVAPQFFFMLRGLLTDAIYLGIARLLDPPEQGTNENLSIQRVINSETSSGSPERTKSQSQLDEVIKVFSSGRDIRNKILAHADCKLVMDYQNSVETNSIPIKTLGEIVEKIKSILKIIYPNNTLPPHPHDQKDWLGVDTILNILSK
jgi:hypothetical protein